MTVTAPHQDVRVGGPRPARSADIVVAAGVVAVLACLVGGLALHVANEGSPLAPGVTDWWAMPVVGSIAFGGAGLWLARVRPALRIGWLLAGVGVVLATSWVALEYGVRALAGPAAAASPALATGVFWYANWAWAAALVTVGTVVPLVLPLGRLPSSRWRPGLVLAVAAVVVVTVPWMFTAYAGWSGPLRRAGIENPFAADWATSVTVGVVQLVVVVAAVAVSLASVVVRWRGASPEGREQLKWLGLGAAAGLVLFSLGFALGPVATALALVPLPAACLVAALRHGLWDVDVVISRSLVYAALMTVVVALYAGVVALLGGVLGATTGAPIVATAAVAVLALPLHRRLTRLVNRLVHGEPEEPFAVLQRLGERLAAAEDDATLAEQVLPDVVGGVARALRLPYVAIQLADGTIVEAPPPHQHPGVRGLLEVPLVYAGAEVGGLVVAAPPRGLTGPGRRALGGLAEQAAVAVHTVVLARDVRRSRRLAVTAQEEERRRLYRDLHDGLGPSLAALALQVEAARDLVLTDPDRARALLGRAHGRLTGTVAEVRAVVHGLRPAALDDLGLPQALHELGGRFADGRLDVRVEVSELPELPAGVEVAAYAVAAEGLANAARHARARTVSLEVDAGPHEVVVRVGDDGAGIPADAVSGVGIVSMRRRAEEVGGSLVIAAGPGGRGTVLEARLPLGTP